MYDLPTSDDLALPPGTRLLHIGPFKTGTSALQGAFAQARHALAGHGVVYPAGALRHWFRPTIALTGALSIRGHPKAEPKHWERLIEAFAQAGDNTVLHSCEFFCDSERQHIVRAVDELGGAHPVHITITVRPLAAILPSQWQMHIQDGWIQTPYETWLRQIFEDAPIDPGDPTNRFWHRHDHAALAARWAEVVGPRNVTVIVADPHDRYAILRPFEAILGLPPGLLEFEPGHVNGSLPYGSTEMLRKVNRKFMNQGWNDRDYGRLIRHGATARMRAEHVPLPAEGPARTPSWAHERAIEIGARIADRLADSGVRVVGDLDHLRTGMKRQDPPAPSATDASTPSAALPGEAPEALVAADAASHFAIGILEHQQERAAELRESLAKSRHNARRARQKLATEQKTARRLADELAAAKKALDPARTEHRRAVDLDSQTLLRIIARRVINRLRPRH